jgi:hypothetical protein
MTAVGEAPLASRNDPNETPFGTIGGHVHPSTHRRSHYHHERQLDEIAGCR